MTNEFPNPQNYILDFINKLLTTKHLYQSIQIEELPAKGTSPEQVILHRGFVNKVFYSPWKAYLANEPIAKEPLPMYGASPVLFSPNRISLYCEKCGQMPFMPISFTCLSTRGKKKGSVGDIVTYNQTFSATYRCSQCDVDTSFLIKRSDRKLSVEGRSPIEFVPAPGNIPSDAASFYRSAVVAHQSGQTLAGLFLLRTLLEQYVRKLPNSPSVKNAGELMDWYLTLLPDDFKNRKQSMSETYGVLSEKLHAADADAVVFEKVAQDIVDHFVALKVWPVNPRAVAEALSPV